MRCASVCLGLAVAGAASALDDFVDDFYAQIEHPVTSGHANSTARLVLMDDFAKSTGAVCLDGSPGAFYFRNGTGSGANKWYVHHQGGGWCENLEKCLERANTSLGTTSGDHPVNQGLFKGYFSTSETVNPLMWNWNMVYVRYCDGGSHSGANSTVTQYKGTSLHFRGSAIREATVATLLRDYRLGEATDAVISGCSAGGLAAYLHTNAWCDKLPKAKCVGLPDSGWFLDYQAPSTKHYVPRPGAFHDGLVWVYRQMNSTSGVNQDCIKARTKTGDPELCIFAEHSAVYTRYPMFALQSEYDTWQQRNVLANHSATHVQILGDNITSRMKADLFKNHPESGTFLDSCAHHCGSWNEYVIDGMRSSEAMMTWYEGLGKKGGKTLWIQGKPYPCTDCCHPSGA